MSPLIFYSNRRSWQFRLLLFALISIVLLLAIGVQWVLAHAELRRSEPSAGAVLDRAPSEVLIWYSSKLKPGGKISILDTQFRAVEKGETSIDSTDTTLMRVPLSPLAPGRYTVNWKAIAEDSDPTSGSYDFFVRESTDWLPLVLVVGIAALIGVVGGGLWIKRRGRDTSASKTTTRFS